MATRTTLMLDEDVRSAARELAHRYGCSTSEAIRRAVLRHRDVDARPSSLPGARNESEFSNACSICFRATIRRMRCVVSRNRTRGSDGVSRRHGFSDLRTPGDRAGARAAARGRRSRIRRSCISSVAWYEFSRGPRTPEQLATARALFARGWRHTVLRVAGGERRRRVPSPRLSAATGRGHCDRRHCGIVRGDACSRETPGTLPASRAWRSKARRPPVRVDNAWCPCPPGVSERLHGFRVEDS